MFFVKSNTSLHNQITQQQLLPLILIGMVTGLLFYGAFYFYQKSVKDNGVSISIAVGKMGIILPMLLSILLWNEVPTSIQWIGIIVSLLAILIININPLELKNSQIHLSLIMFFIIGGLGDFGNKLFETVVGSEYSELFLTVVFGTALIASLYKTLKHKGIQRLSILYGISVGVPNMLTAYFLIMALSTMNAAVVFPLYSGGAIVLSMLYSLFRFGERLKIKEFISIGLIVMALILINL